MKIPWSLVIWKYFIPPRFSILLWRIFHRKLPTDDLLRRRGITIVSTCLLCSVYNCCELVEHLFCSCSFTRNLWLWIAEIFNVSISNFVHLIWRTRNLVRFQDANPCSQGVKALGKSILQVLCHYCPGNVPHFNDLCILSRLGIHPKFGKAPKVNPVYWSAPPVNWIKVNTDGLSKHNPGPSACGGIFRDYNGSFIGGFASSLGIQTSFFVEVMAVIFAVEKA
ncbi:Ribonuclease H [Melia azedarach]|uniref:Ribonuclease H n=1 Tax=Melia azedarach TaxID=155640 RepID=A0ACC1Y1H4_MELAZ|nr:Ribonuclease H [Melia azedarach]